MGRLSKRERLERERLREIERMGKGKKDPVRPAPGRPGLKPARGKAPTRPYLVDPTGGVRAPEDRRYFSAPQDTNKESALRHKQAIGEAYRRRRRNNRQTRWGSKLWT